ncbi:hypothetical protein NPIL_312391 [Nephila pilipes]|uniref:Uncharacterized protein n=1 Tax=Nephila pilipes TaxID=299642 RepID=A0A8X6NRI4_NEPPI|nr:hypothetical protein NPIL_312391 [Nephila pilipes]
MTIQKTVFALNVVPETVVPTLLQNSFRLGDFQKLKRYHQKDYKIPPPTPSHPPAEERPALGKIPFKIELKEIFPYKKFYKQQTRFLDSLYIFIHKAIYLFC